MENKNPREMLGAAVSTRRVQTSLPSLCSALITLQEQHRLLQVHGVQVLSGGTTSQLLTSISVKFRIELLSSRWPHIYSLLTQIRAYSRTRTYHRRTNLRRKPRLVVSLFEDQGASYPPRSNRALSAPTAHICPVRFLNANWMVNDAACFSREH